MVIGKPSTADTKKKSENSLTTGMLRWNRKLKICTKLHVPCGMLRWLSMTWKHAASRNNPNLANRTCRRRVSMGSHMRAGVGNCKGRSTKVKMLDLLKRQ